MQAEQKVMLPRSIQELLGIIFSDVKIQEATECSCKLSALKSTLTLIFHGTMSESMNTEYLYLFLI